MTPRALMSLLRLLAVRASVTRMGSCRTAMKPTGISSCRQRQRLASLLMRIGGG